MARLSDMFRHNLWANLKLLDACEGLSDEMLDSKVEGTYGTVRDTLVHLFGAERRYAQRLQGDARTPIPDGQWPGFAELRALAEDTGNSLIALSEADRGDDHEETDFGGKRWLLAPSVVFVQAINHATEHRAHVMTTITAHGAEAVDLDSWAWGEATGGLKLIG